MENQKSFADRMEAFFAGKGFYIVLFLCVAVIGVSAWSMLSGGDAAPADDPGMSMAVSRLEEPVAEANVPAAAEKAETDTLREVPPAVSTAAPIVPAPAAVESPDATAQQTAQASEAPAQASDYFIWPVTGEIENPFSVTVLTFNRTMQDWRVHDGIDIAAELGTQVKATSNGTVAEIYRDDLYGTTVVISHRDGLTSVYSNLAETPTVSEGQQVSVGQVIGAVGDTALAETGEVCHLHFAMQLDGVSLDPVEYMP